MEIRQPKDRPEFSHRSEGPIAGVGSKKGAGSAPRRRGESLKTTKGRDHADPPERRGGGNEPPVALAQLKGKRRLWGCRCGEEDAGESARRNLRKGAAPSEDRAEKSRSLKATLVSRERESPAGKGGGAGTFKRELDNKCGGIRRKNEKGRGRKKGNREVFLVAVSAIAFGEKEPKGDG